MSDGKIDHCSGEAVSSLQKRILEFETRVRPSDLFAKQFKASNGTPIETLLQHCKVSSHPLEDWKEYMEFATRYLSHDQARQILRRYIKSCIRMPQYKNSHDLLESFLLFTKTCKEPLKDFQFAWECGVFRELPVFWVWWTHYAKAEKQYHLTSRLFKTSLECVRGEENRKFMNHLFNKFKAKMQKVSCTTL